MTEYHKNPFTYNIKEFIIDEIALEGLEGIGLNSLWKRLEARICSPITDKMKVRFWSYIVNRKSISFYVLRTPLPNIEIFDRLTIIDDETGYLKDPVSTYLFLNVSCRVTLNYFYSPFTPYGRATRSLGDWDDWVSFLPS